MTFPNLVDPNAGDPANNNVDPNAGTDSGHNPNWNTILAAVPSQFHAQVLPELKKWDEGVRGLTDKVHSEYAAWKPFKDQGITPEQVQASLGFANALEQDPKRVVDALREYYKLTDEVQQQAQQQGQVNPLLMQQQQQAAQNLAGQQGITPEVVQSLRDNQNILAQALMSQQRATLEQAEDKRLTEELDAAKKKYGQQYGYDFDEETVIAYLANGPKGMTTEKAVETYYGKMQQFLTQRQRPAPSVLGAGGGTPSGGKSVNAMTDAEFNSTALAFLNNS